MLAQHAQTYEKYRTLYPPVGKALCVDQQTYEATPVPLTTTVVRV